MQRVATHLLFSNPCSEWQTGTDWLLPLKFGGSVTVVAETCRSSSVQPSGRCTSEPASQPRNGSWRRQSSPSCCCAGRFRLAVGHPFGTAPQFQQSAAKPCQCSLSAVWHSRQLRFLGSMAVAPMTLPAVPLATGQRQLQLAANGGSRPTADLRPINSSARKQSLAAEVEPSHRAAGAKHQHATNEHRGRQIERQTKPGPHARHTDVVHEKVAALDIAKSLKAMKLAAV